MEYDIAHFRHPDYWKQRSEEEVDGCVLHRTSVLNDHQVIIGRKVCLEISQVDVPKLESLSQARLNTYGYDSTSVFLWGYIQILKKNLLRCYEETVRNRDKVNAILQSNGNGVEKLVGITEENIKLYVRMELSGRMKSSCIEDRHRRFIENGIENTGLGSMQSEIKEMFSQIDDAINVAIAVENSSTNHETSAVLKSINRANRLQAESSGKMNLLTIIFSTSAVCTMANYIISIWKKGDHVKGRILVLVLCIAGIFAVWCIAGRIHRRKAEKNGEDISDSVTV